MQHEIDAQSLSDMTVLQELSTYLLPKDNPDFRWRIGTAMSLLVVSKLINVSVSHATIISSFTEVLCLDSMISQPQGWFQTWYCQITSENSHLVLMVHKAPDLSFKAGFPRACFPTSKIAGMMQSCKSASRGQSNCEGRLAR